MEILALDDSFKPKTELGIAMKMMVENGDHCDGNIYWLIHLIEQNEKSFKEYTETLNETRRKRDDVSNKLAIALKEIKELKQENKRLNQLIGKYAGKMSDIATLNDALSKEIRKFSNEMIML